MGLVTPWLLNAPDHFALLHGDYRLDNLLFDGRRITVVDWRDDEVGLAGRDLAYFRRHQPGPDVRAGSTPTSSAITPALLVRASPAMTFQTCWDSGGHDPGAADLGTGVCAFSIETTERGDDAVSAMLRRGCQAIRDLGTLDLIDAMGRTPWCESPPRTAVIGAIINGLTSGKMLKDYSVPATIFELSDRIGGTGIQNPNGSNAFVRCIDDPQRAVVFRFPIPQRRVVSAPQRHQGVLGSYADTFGLLENIGSTTASAAGLRPDGRWDITDQQGSTREFDLLVVGNGHHWDADTPVSRASSPVSLPPHHYIDPQSPLKLSGKRILVVGIGNSGRHHRRTVLQDTAEQRHPVDPVERLDRAEVHSSPLDSIARTSPYIPLSRQHQRACS